MKRVTSAVLVASSAAAAVTLVPVVILAGIAFVAWSYGAEWPDWV